MQLVVFVMLQKCLLGKVEKTYVTFKVLHPQTQCFHLLHKTFFRVGKFKIIFLWYMIWKFPCSQNKRAGSVHSNTTTWHWMWIRLLLTLRGISILFRSKLLFVNQKLFCFLGLLSSIVISIHFLLIESKKNILSRG